MPSGENYPEQENDDWQDDMERRLAALERERILFQGIGIGLSLILTAIVTIVGLIATIRSFWS